MKRFFLIDLENVGHTFLGGIDKLSVEDTLVICHNMTHGKNISPSITSKLHNTKATIRQINILNRGKNAMDFALSTQLGLLIAENGNKAQYFIVSHDKGFDASLEFATTLDSNITVRRIGSIEEEVCKEIKEQELKDTLNQLLKGYNKGLVKITRQCILNSKDCRQFHNLLQKKLYAKDFHDVYVKVRHLLPPSHCKRCSV